MKIYLVGGAVRDQLLNLPVRERDWVVIGATPEQLLAQGFKPVGKDFPVFLHPITHEEYALARTERKIAKGYQGFAFYTAPDITIEEDLCRRDLTINAIAQAEDGTIIDPYHGIEDLLSGILRHVSPAFVEDPLRVLRVARFAARFGNFSIAKETIALMKTIVQSDELAALAGERIFKELQRALSENYPQRFFNILQECNAFNYLFPEINLSNLKFLEHAVNVTKEPAIRFAVLFANSQEENNLQLFAKRLPLPRHYYELAELTYRFHADLLLIETHSPEFILTLLKKSDAFRRTQRFLQLLTVCQAIYFDVTAFSKTMAILNEILQRCTKLRIDTTTAQISGATIAQAIDAQRLAIIKELLD